MVGALLLVFELQWLRKGALRITAEGCAIGQGGARRRRRHGPDRSNWTGFVLSFKGVSLEALEFAIIVVAIGGAGALGSATIGADRRRGGHLSTGRTHLAPGAAAGRRRPPLLLRHVLGRPGRWGRLARW